MEKIKCPFCGAEMDSNMKYCPFCGKKIEKQNTENHKKENEVFVGPPPKKFSWVTKWRIKPIIWRIVFGVLFALFFALAFKYVSEELKELKASSGYESHTDSTFFIIAATTFFVLFIDSLLRCRVTTKNIDGYNVVVACGYFHRLIIEDEVVVWRLNVSTRMIFSNHTEEMIGYLPNRKKVWADVNDFFGHAIIGVSKTKDN